MITGVFYQSHDSPSFSPIEIYPPVSRKLAPGQIGSFNVCECVVGGYLKVGAPPKKATSKSPFKKKYIGGYRLDMIFVICLLKRVIKITTNYVHPRNLTAGYPRMMVWKSHLGSGRLGVIGVTLGDIVHLLCQLSHATCHRSTTGLRDGMFETVCTTALCLFLSFGCTCLSITYP